MNLRLGTLQRMAILVTVALGLAYTLVLLPAVRRLREGERPRRELKERLARASIEAGLEREAGFDTIGGWLAGLRAAVASFEMAVAEAEPRLDQPPEVVERLGEEPFRLVEFLNESQRRLEELAAEAHAAKVALTPGLPRGFPRYQAELARPELLWVQLALVTRAVRTAIRAGVREVKEISVNPLPWQETAEYGPPPASVTSPAPGRRADLRVHVTVVGSADAVGRLLYALALTPEELKAAGLPDELAGRPALFIDQILLRRTTLEATEEVRLDVVVGTVVFGEGV